jgi:hypothetical protein
MTDNLGAYNSDEYGSVDLFGLDEFGQPTGPYPAFGAGLGAGIQAGGALIARRMGKDKYAEAIGAGVGVAASMAMLLVPKMRTMAWTAFGAALGGGLVRQLENSLVTKEKEKAAAGENATAAEKNGEQKGMGLVEIEPTATLGLPTVEPTQALGDGMGMPPQLVGAGDYGLSQNPAAAQATLVGPGVSGLGAHFGSTIFG